MVKGEIRLRLGGDSVEIQLLLELFRSAGLQTEKQRSFTLLKP